MECIHDKISKSKSVGDGSRRAKAANGNHSLARIILVFGADMKKKSVVRAAEVQETLLQQIQNYLTGIISKEDYALIAEEYYSSYGNRIKGSEFYKIFSENIPDCCLIYVDEPGNDIEKEYAFHKILAETYDKLKRVLE